MIASWKHLTAALLQPRTWRLFRTLNAITCVVAYQKMYYSQLDNKSNKPLWQKEIPAKGIQDAGPKNAQFWWWDRNPPSLPRVRIGSGWSGAAVSIVTVTNQSATASASSKKNPERGAKRCGVADCPGLLLQCCQTHSNMILFQHKTNTITASQFTDK